MSLAEKIAGRELEPHHVFLASFLAGLNEMGILNQASVNVAARRAGRYLAEYARVRGGLPEPGSTAVESAGRLARYLGDLLGLATEFEAGTEDGVAYCSVLSGGCRFCPKGVGEAELEGTICPYPGLIEEFVNQLLPGDQRIALRMQDRRPLAKVEGHCLMQFV